MYRNSFFSWSHGVMQPLFEEPGDGGGGGGDGAGGDGGDGAGDPADDPDHPDYAIPGGAGDGDPVDTAGQPGAGDPANPKPKPAGDGRRPAGDGRTAETVPIHRLNEVTAAKAELEAKLKASDAEAKKLRALVAGALGITDPDAKPGTAPKVLNDREQKIADRILELVPWLGKLKGLADKAEIVSGLADQVPEFSRQNDAYWKRVATTMMTGMEEVIAPLFLGEGKTAKDLSPQLKARYRVDFVDWVGRDQARVERYESADKSLLDDYRKELDETIVQPIRRQAGASVLAGNRTRAKLPVAGSGAAPVVGTSKPKVEASVDEDAAADAAWKRLQELTTAGQ